MDSLTFKSAPEVFTYGQLSLVKPSVLPTFDALLSLM